VKTIHQLVQEKITHSAALATDPARLNTESNRLLIGSRIGCRMTRPSLLSPPISAQALAATLLVLPPSLHRQAIQSLLMQTVVEWEDVALEYEAQLKPAPLG
jgi:hypothetical protein